jgi:hypothetical protein
MRRTKRTRAFINRAESRSNRLPSAPTARRCGLARLEDDERLVAFRYQDLILLKNQSQKGIVVRGRPLGPGSFCRHLYRAAHRARLNRFFTYQDPRVLFNAKKTSRSRRCTSRSMANDEVQDR